MIALLLAISLQWDWNTEPHLGGYKVYCGIESGKPTISMDVGKVNQWNIDEFLETQSYGMLYFAVTAYNTEDQEGLPSNEVAFFRIEPSATVPPHTHSWDEITGKPDTFPNAPHTHPIVPAETGVGQ